MAGVQMLVLVIARGLESGGVEAEELALSAVEGGYLGATASGNSVLGVGNDGLSGGEVYQLLVELWD